MSLRADLCREVGRNAGSVPAGYVQVGDGGVHPGVKDVRFSGKGGSAALRTGMLGFVDGRVDRKIGFVGQNHLAAFVTEPHWDRGGEQPLTGDTPVPLHLFRPVFQALEHVFRIPFDLAGGFDDLVTLDLDEPLAFGEDLNRRLASPATADTLIDLFLVFEDAELFHVGKDCSTAFLCGHAFVLAADGGHGAFGGECFSEGEVVLLPPEHIGLVTKGTDHNRTGTEVHVNGVVGNDGDFVTEDRYTQGFADDAFVAVVVGVYGNGNTCGKEFRARGGNLQSVEVEEVEERGSFVVGYFGKGDCGFTAGTVVDRVFVLVDVAGFEHPQEGELRFCVVVRLHGDVFMAPVNGEPHGAQGLPHLFDVFDGEFAAHAAELFTGDIVFGDVVGLFHFDLGRQSVAVPALREHDVIAGHALVPGDDIHVNPV